MISRTALCSAQLATIRSARSGPTPGTSRSRAGSDSITPKTPVPNASTSRRAKCGPTPRTSPEARKRSIPSAEVGATVVSVSARNWGPCFGSLVQLPEARTSSPAETAAACPTTVTASRLPRTRTRRTTKPDSSERNVTRSTWPARSSRSGGAASAFMRRGSYGREWRP